MYDRLTHFLDKYNILYQNQFGFRQGHSTHHALISLVDKIIKSLNSGDIVIGAFLYLKKSFDTVDHNILFKKISIWYPRKLKYMVQKFFDQYIPICFIQWNNN